MGQISAKLRRAQTGYVHWCPGCEQMHLIPDGWTFDGNVDRPTFQPSVKITYNGPDAGQLRDYGHRAPARLAATISWRPACCAIAPTARTHLPDVTSSCRTFRSSITILSQPTEDQAMNDIPVFFIEPTDRERRWLRRYTSNHKCAKTGHYCNAMFEVGEADIRYTADGYIDATGRDAPPNDDPRWPLACEACGRPFEPKDERQLFSRQIYIRESTGQRWTLSDVPPGACWDAWWFSERRGHKGKTGCGHMIGPDHRTLVVRCPDGHDWMIDGRASNCTRKDDDEHFCWVRHGRPEDGTLHVDKNGNTCSAGAGSILTPKWHGFLHNGRLRPS